MCFHRFLHSLLHTVHFHWRQKLTIRQLGKSLVLTIDSNKPFHIIIPGCYILITNRPVNTHTILNVRFKIHLAQAQASTSPHERFSSYLKAAIPVEALHLSIGAIKIVYPKLLVQLTIKTASGLHRMGSLLFLSKCSTVLELPGRRHGCVIVCDMLYISASLKQ